jgi:hypothetical protein
VIDPRLRTLPRTTADHLTESYGADVGEVLATVLAELVYAARRERAA